MTKARAKNYEHNTSLSIMSSKKFQNSCNSFLTVFKFLSLYFPSCGHLFFLQWSSALLLHSLTIFSQPLGSFLVDMSVFLFKSVCACMRGCVLAGLTSCCCCFLLQWCGDYFGNPPHLPHPFSCGDAGCPGLGQTLLDGCESPPTSSEGHWSHLLSLPLQLSHTGAGHHEQYDMGNVTPREAINSTWVLRLAVTLQCTAELSMPKQWLFKMELYGTTCFWSHRGWISPLKVFLWNCGHTASFTTVAHFLPIPLNLKPSHLLFKAMLAACHSLLIAPIISQL